ncbi:Oidioi.mRNA.OKI2018_I69.XSR.g16899.t1.cds [Oikopleura dioica]|uniref:Oidioi.mRNA.OKI2018_I69.XSR.g16899.t1.cds n=1 Tax=Oikopleura dioica TaxID=34765 RepID=A0ABN7SHJ4_OIKDI|nr:Oidioi.mRNA.OKI2018_I69.XSR.g16899.t1.cds [Oikopleura dioica]
MQVKVILHRGPSEEVLPRKEIRRFFLEKLDSFQHLKDQVIMLYDDLTADTTLRFLWTDEEGDNVQFSSDKEMKEAVNFFQNQQGENKLFKLIVRFPQPPPPPAAQKAAPTKEPKETTTTGKTRRRWRRRSRRSTSASARRT